MKVYFILTERQHFDYREGSKIEIHKKSFLDLEKAKIELKKLAEEALKEYDEEDLMKYSDKNWKLSEQLQICYLYEYVKKGTSFQIRNRHCLDDLSISIFETEAN